MTYPRAFLLFVLAWAALAFPWLSGAVTIPWDAKAHWYPHLVATARALHAGESPFWMPWIFLGSPEIADPQSVLFSPVLLALALFDPAPSPTAMDRAVLSTLLIGGGGVILMFRDRGWRPEGGLVAALALAFGAAVAWRIQHVNQVMTAMLYPLASVLLGRALGGSKLAGLGAGLVAGIIVASRDQVALLVVYLLALQAVWTLLDGARPMARTKAALLPLILGGLVGFFVVTPPVVLTALWTGQSNRLVIDLDGAGRGSLHPAHLLSAAIGNLYGAAGELRNHWGPPSPTWPGTDLFLARNMGVAYIGAIPLLLLLSLVRTGALFRREALFFVAAFAFVVLYALGKYTPAFALFWHLPGVDYFRRPADALFLVGALGAILSGYAMHALVEGRLATRFVAEGICALAALAAGAALILALGGPAIAWAAWAIGAASLAAGWLALRWAAGAFAEPAGRRTSVALVLPLILAIDLSVTNGPSESTALPTATYDVLTPGAREETLALVSRLLVRDETRRDRVEFIALPYEWQNVAMSHGLEDVIGFNPVRSAALADLVGAGDIALIGARRFPPAFPSYASPMADALGLRVVVSGEPIERLNPGMPPDALRLVARTATAFVYERPRVAPRVMIAARLRSTPTDLATAGFPADFDPMAEAFVEGPPPPTAGGRARITDYRATRVSVETDTPGPGLLVLADAWHPWWRARVNGVETPILRVNGLVRGVVVPAGRAEVLFEFRPFSGAMAELAAKMRR